MKERKTEMKTRRREREAIEREQQKLYDFEQQRMIAKERQEEPSDCGWI
jgi:hypothetical protein